MKHNASVANTPVKCAVSNVDEILRTAQLQRTANIRTKVPSFKRAAELMLINDGKCIGFEESCQNIGTFRRQNTAYVNDDLNWMYLCDDCQKVASEYWKRMWDDYYRNCM